MDAGSGRGDFPLASQAFAEVCWGMFQTRRIQVEAVQCMACGRYRVDGLWLHQDIHAHEVSHTFCPDCVPAVREDHDETPARCRTTSSNHNPMCGLLDKCPMPS